MIVVGEEAGKTTYFDKDLMSSCYVPDSEGLIGVQLQIRQLLSLWDF